MDSRLPAHLEINGLIRAVQAAGGFATVIAKGERDAGTILIVTMDRQGHQRLFERMPQLDGSRKFVASRDQDENNPLEFNEYLERRKRQDSDIWVLELDIADAERFIVNIGTV
ncbi:DUF1491 family protein [Altererythrobacter sp. ZODW24]|uniref:DUF1491 family protein n=1 Tax=Altererythrobacter sp. ZODW24 TaxID=2185142 RepID=UPI000DF7CE63|nr:DUF1491 family protein [Altererythrobacter sp. ZODW24]